MFMAFYIGLFTLIVFVITQIALEGNITALTKEVILVALLGVAGLLSIPLAINPAEAWQNYSEILIKALLMFIVLVNVVRTGNRLMLLLWLALIVSVYLSVNAISDYQKGIFVIGKADLARIGGSIGGLFKNSNDLALHLVTMVPIAVCLGLITKGPLRKIIYWATAALMVSATIVTFSRGGFLGLIGVVLVFAYKLGKKNKVATFATLGLAAVLFIAFAPGSYGDRLGTIFNSAADLSGSSSQRTQVLKRSVIVALRYPIFGVGIGNFHHRSFQELGTHNAYTQVASEIGIPAFVIYVMFLLYPLKRLRQIEKETFGKKEDRRFYYMSIGLQASLIGYMVSSFFGAVAYQWYVYYLVGYAVCLHRLFLMQTPALSHVSWERPFSKSSKTAKLVNQPTVASMS
jgi:O-antigen ligase